MRDNKNWPLFAEVDFFDLWRVQSCFMRIQNAINFYFVPLKKSNFNSKLHFSIFSANHLRIFFNNSFLPIGEKLKKRTRSRSQKIQDWLISFFNLIAAHIFRFSSISLSSRDGLIQTLYVREKQKEKHWDLKREKCREGKRWIKSRNIHLGLREWDIDR